MTYLLNLAYLAAAVCLAPVLVYRSLRTGKYRSGWSAKLLGNVPVRPGDATCVWIHAVSVGEVNLLPGLVDRLQQSMPTAEIVVSTTTATGFALAQQRFSDHTVFYCPLDFSWSVRRAMNRVRPTMLILSELELWPNLIRIAHDRGTKVVVANARLSEQSYRGYRRFRWVLSATFQRLSLVLAQNPTYAERFVDLGVARESTIVTGSIKFDGAVTNPMDPRVVAFGQLAAVADDMAVWVVGSTQAPEEQMAIDVFKRLMGEHAQLRLLIVPRHPERFDSVATQIEASGFELLRRSKLDTPADEWSQQTILLVDTIGELSAWWGVARIAFVGGSMGSRGGQNMLEPAGYGAAVSFGPNTRNFRDIVSQLLAADAATVVASEQELEQFVRECLTNPDAAAAQGRRAQELVLSGQGALQRSVAEIIALLSKG